MRECALETPSVRAETKLRRISVEPQFSERVGDIDFRQFTLGEHLPTRMAVVVELSEGSGLLLRG